jgi:hypothetical protein
MVALFHYVYWNAYIDLYADWVFRIEDTSAEQVVVVGCCCLLATCCSWRLVSVLGYLPTAVVAAKVDR